MFSITVGLPLTGHDFLWLLRSKNLTVLWGAKGFISQRGPVMFKIDDPWSQNRCPG